VLVAEENVRFEVCIHAENAKTRALCPHVDACVRMRATRVMVRLRFSEVFSETRLVGGQGAPGRRQGTVKRTAKRRGQGAGEFRRESQRRT
jgi:hypothetical protein